MEFPYFKTKLENLKKEFDLFDNVQLREYFEAKAKKEIEKLKDFVRERSFIAYLIGKKNSGKGTYAKMFAEIVDPQKVEHLSVGDLVRKTEEDLKDEKKKKEILKEFSKIHRGFTKPELLEEIFEKRSTQTLFPTDVILTLLKMEIGKKEKKTLFIDGFPRDLDQLSLCLFFRELIGYREDPDVFVLIETPNSVIEERIKWRRVCPICQTSRNLKLLPTSKVVFEDGQFHLICEKCNVKMVEKEGDQLGIEPIKERLKKEEEMVEKILQISGVPKIFLKNGIEVSVAKDYVDEYEITPEFEFEYDEKERKVIVKKKPFVVKDDFNRDVYSLLAPPVVLCLIKQLVDVLNL